MSSTSENEKPVENLKKETKKPVAKPKTKTVVKKDIEPVIEPADTLTVEKDLVHQKSWKYLKEVNSESDERLERIALISMDRKYTYRQMFRNWEKYAEVFSALNITAENNSRLAIFDCTSVEATFAVYGANMTGASVAGFTPMCISDKYPIDKVIQTEKITDLFIVDLVINEKLLVNILRKKKDLGLRNIIISRVEIESDNMDADIIKISNDNYNNLKKVQGALFMDDLLREYEATPIKYDTDIIKNDAFIMHTSGTTKGISKPAPLSDIALNAAAENQKKSGKFKEFEKGAVTMCFMVVTSVYGLVNQLHEPLSFGCTVVIPPMATNNPFVLKSIGYYKVNVLFITPFYFEVWGKMPKEYIPDFSSVKLIVVGGAYMSSEARKRYKALVKEKGGDANFINGYGMSETGGACIIQTEEVDSDSIGKPLPGVNVKIYDENDEKFYSIEDGHTGVLYINSESISEGKIDGESFFETEDIDGIPYICTNDVVEVASDGSLACKGRANRYFVNNDGVKFNAGLVENWVASEQGIEACAITPWFDKLVTHDTVPVLYVQTLEHNKESVETVRKALINIFINNGKSEESNLPVQCVIVDNIPRNANGKVDIYHITNTKVEGERYVVRPIREDGRLKDIVLEYDADSTASVSNGAIPAELSKTIEDAQSTARDETVLNMSGNIINAKMMEAYTRAQMMNMPQQMMEQFFYMMQNIGAQIWNSSVQMLNYMAQQQQNIMVQQPYVPQSYTTTPYAPQQINVPVQPYTPQPPIMQPLAALVTPTNSDK
jgi:acyl-coenzyme A synthetase/AMP-(fatty) acid ligase